VSSRRPLSALAAAALAVVALAGCGLGAGSDTGSVRLVVQRDFGTKPVGTVDQEVKSSDTVMRVLQRHFRVKTRYGGGFVQSIGGVGGGHRAGRPVDWFYYVNGLEAGKGAATTKARGGDTILWDHHDWGAGDRTAAIVGSWPEPFDHGTNGKRRPLRLECADAAKAACDVVAKALARYGIQNARAAIDTVVSRETLRIVVGTWKDVGHTDGTNLLPRGPGVSGVYAKPTAHGLALLDPTGKTVSTYGAGTGLVAATKAEAQQATWVVTGVDEAGVLRAAQAMTAKRLRGAFALAVAQSGDVKLPLEASR
jgi:hypothetical protein